MRYAFLKRLCDLLLSGFGLVLLAPAGLLISLLIKATSSGPVFYGQTRIGQFGKPFRLWKFRTMVVNAEQIGMPLTSGEDPRITPFGRLLRRTKVDELPQLWNVLVGQMSLVGPRPEVARYVERYTREQRAILEYKPGITDLASLLFRREEELLRGAANLEDFYVRYCMPKKLELNQRYAEQASVGRDLWIVLQTILPCWVGVMLLYCFCLSGSFWLACELKSDFRLSRMDCEQFLRLMPLVVFPQLLFLGWGDHLREVLSCFHFPELRRTVGSLAAALAVQVGLGFSLTGRVVPNLSILLIDFLLSIVVLCGLRTVLSVLREQRSQPTEGCRKRRVALIGTGELATNLLLDLARTQAPVRRVVAVFDDDPRTWHKRRHNVPVVGMPECLLNRHWLEQIDEVVVALPQERTARIQELGRMLKGLPVRVTIAGSEPISAVLPV